MTDDLTALVQRSDRLMTYELCEQQAELGVWSVEGIDQVSGECHKTNFYGPHSRERAEAYLGAMLRDRLAAVLAGGVPRPQLQKEQDDQARVDGERLLEGTGSTASEKWR